MTRCRLFIQHFRSYPHDHYKDNEVNLAMKNTRKFSLKGLYNEDIVVMVNSVLKSALLSTFTVFTQKIFFGDFCRPLSTEKVEKVGPSFSRVQSKLIMSILTIRCKKRQETVLNYITGPLSLKFK